MRPFKPSDKIALHGKQYLYLNDDDPIRAYQTDNVSFVAQPLARAEENKQYNVIPVPLMMTDEWEIVIKNPEIVEELRSIPKTTEYMFIGQCHYMGREVFRDLELPNYYFAENPRGIFHLPSEDKQQELVKFLKTIAQARFLFAPRGMGSSSFRLYQSFMVGSVPIVTGMNDYPFSNVVDWDSMCIRGDLNELDKLIEKSKDIDWDTLSNNGKAFWDSYCRHDALYGKLMDRTWAK